jgi:hypothetical protein
MRPIRCSSTAAFHGSSMLMHALAARCRFRPTPPASVAKRTRHAGSSWNPTMFCVRRFWPSSPVKNAVRTLSRASTSRVAQCASRSILRHWLNTTTLRSWSRASWPISSRSSRSFGRQPLQGGLRRPLEPRQVRPDLLEPELGQAIRDDPLSGKQHHQPQELRLRERPPLRSRQKLRDRHVEGVVLLDPSLERAAISLGMGDLT